MIDKLYCIEVIDAETNEPIKSLEATSLRTAERVEEGMNINLNHMRYYTRIVEKGKP